MRVRGLDQIPDYAEFANALLLQNSDGPCLHVTTYQPKPEPKMLTGRVGADTGIKEQLVLSNGIQLQFQVPVTKKIRRLHRELSKRQRHGKNWRKTQTKLDRAYDACTRQKRDTRNKIVSKLTRTYGTISYQNDNVAGWQRMWGRRIQATAIGGLTSALRKKTQTPIVVDRFFPSTNTCSRCGAIHEIGLDERVYRCGACGRVIDRNLNAATNINNWRVPVECREVTPVDTKTATELLEYFNSIPGVRASLVEEAGSPQAMSIREEAHDFNHG